MRSVWMWAVLALCGCSQTVALGIAIPGSLEVGGITRTYTLYLPSDSSKPRALLIALHGGGGNGAGMRSLTGLDSLADQGDFLLVYPDGYQKNWADGRGGSKTEQAGSNDVVFIASLIDQLSKNYAIDANRIFVTGISNGGFMAGRLACELSNRVAAVAIVAATFVKNLQPTCQPARAVPLMLIHGSADPLVNAEGGTMVVGNGGEILSTTATVQLWKGLNGCTGQAAPLTLDTQNDGTRTILERSTGCTGGSALDFYNVVDGGHAWPGGLQYLPIAIIGKTSRDFSASQLIWEFFKAHPKP